MHFIVYISADDKKNPNLVVEIRDSGIVEATQL